MSPSGDDRAAFRLLRGGREARLGGVRLVAAPCGRAPFPVDATVAEEDTHLLLSAGSRLRDPGESMPRLMLRALNQQAASPGTVVVRGRGPRLRLLAVVHDLERDPSWREEWVAGALAQVLEAAGRRRLRAVALPLLGTRHGRLAPERFFELLRGALACAPAGVPPRLWIVLSGRRAEGTLAAFRAAFGD